MTVATHSARPIDLNIACIPSNYSRLIARELGLQMRDFPKLLHLTGMTTEQFLRDDALLTTSQQIQIVINALQLSGGGALGLLLGRRLTPLTHGVMGLLVNSSPNLLTTMRAIQAFLPTRMNFARLELVTERGWLECHCHFDIDSSDAVLRCLSEALAMAFFECARFILGRRLHEAVTYFAHSKPDYVEEYSDYLPGEVHFSQSSIMIKIPIAACRVPNVSASRESYALAYKQCEIILAQQHNQKGTCKYQVKKLMLSHPSGFLSEENTAEALFISKRTLARKLKAEDTSFRQIRDEILSKQSAAYLEEGSMSVESISALLGYHDSANFRRAFKRWFSMTPDQYRQQVQA